MTDTQERNGPPETRARAWKVAIPTALALLAVLVSVWAVMRYGEGRPSGPPPPPPAPALDTADYDHRLRLIAHLDDSASTTALLASATATRPLWPAHAPYPDYG